MERPDVPRLPVILGATGVGKTEIAIRVAQAADAEIVSADSRQIYRYMDIGTAKPTIAQRNAVPHWMIDVVEPDVDYSAARYASDATATVTEVRARRRVLVAGGSGLYIRALFEGLFPSPPADRELRRRLLKEAAELGSEALHTRLRRVDPTSANRIHPHDTKRLVRALEIYRMTGLPISRHHAAHSPAPTFAPQYIGLQRERDELNLRIERRVDKMMEEGFLEEARRILKMGYSPDLNSLNTLGYREMMDHLAGKLSIEQAVELTKRQTRAYAKRQMSWFGRIPDVEWLDLSRTSESSVVNRICSIVKST